MSTHKCEVIRIKKEPHPNADALSIVKIKGWQCVVRTDDWTDGQLAAYIEPDSIVPDTEPFAWLKSDSPHWNRIRARRFRGIISLGLLVPAPAGANEGDDVMELMGVTHYEPPLDLSSGGDDEKGPHGYFPVYDVENFNRYGSTLQPGEEVIATEKIHGASARFCWTEGRMWASSHNNWKKQDSKNWWWSALAQNPWIETWCKANPDLVLYCEVFGNVQKLKYGAKPGQLFVRVFDILDKNRWMEVDEIAQKDWGTQLKWVPTLYRGPFDEALLRKLADGESTIEGADHIREGIVVKPIHERSDPAVGRVQLKMISPVYLEKK